MAYTKEQVTKIAKENLGKTFGELKAKCKKLDKELDESKNKGISGLTFEKEAYGLEQNSSKKADFEEAGVELKTTPYKRNQDNSLSAKERMTITLINYLKDYKDGFYDSHLYDKSKCMQIVWYLYEKDKKRSELKITHELLYSYPEEDLPTIIEDYDYIIQKIKEGRAHELSEADTRYLGACTKGNKNTKPKKQPFSEELAKQRAFCLKQSYMTQLVRKHIGGEQLEKVYDDKYKGESFEKIINDKLKNYYGKSRKELCEEFELKTRAKNVNELLLSKMLGIEGKVAKTEEFLKANVVPKTIRVEENGRIIQSMSFPAFKFDKIVKEKWIKSDLYNTFLSTRYMFVIFKKKNKEYYFERIKFWNMPINILEGEVKKVFEKTIDVIKSGDIVKEILPSGKRKTNFPGMKFNKYCHVRPHSKNAEDTYRLPVPDKLTSAKKYSKQCFWLNNKYIKKIIEND